VLFETQTANELWITLEGETMLIYDDIFSWEGFGGPFRLASGQCRLRILDMAAQEHQKVSHIKPILAVVSDLPAQTTAMKSISVRSCAGHIATCLVRQFKIDPHRMTYVEYYPSSKYGPEGRNEISARFEAVDFTWFENKALHPKWRPLLSPMLEIVADLVSEP
jgi:hypothetical protein